MNTTQLRMFEDAEPATGAASLDTKHVDDIYVDADLLDVVKIDDLALDEEFIRFASDLAYWNAKYSSALKRHLLLQHDFDKTRARLWLEIKNEAVDNGEKITVEDLRSMVVLRQEYEDAHLRLIDAEVLKQRTKRDLDNILAKKDMLQSLGAKLRVELEGDPTVRFQHREAKQYG